MLSFGANASNIFYKLGSYEVRERQDEANTIKSDSLILEKAGADFLLLECVPTLLGEEITKALEIPVHWNRGRWADRWSGLSYS